MRRKKDDRNKINEKYSFVLHSMKAVLVFVGSEDVEAAAAEEEDVVDR